MNSYYDGSAYIGSVSETVINLKYKIVGHVYINSLNETFELREIMYKDKTCKHFKLGKFDTIHDEYRFGIIDSVDLVKIPDILYYTNIWEDKSLGIMSYNEDPVIKSTLYLYLSKELNLNIVNKNDDSAEYKSTWELISRDDSSYVDVIDIDKQELLNKDVNDFDDRVWDYKDKFIRIILYNKI